MKKHNAKICLVKFDGGRFETEAVANVTLPRSKRRSNGSKTANGNARTINGTLLNEPIPLPGSNRKLAEIIPVLERLPYDGNTAFRLYLQEVGQTQLLTPKDEVVLAGRIKRGDKKARETMIKANLRLVVKIARSYEDCGMPLLDMISEGNVGLMKAVERFDPTKGAKLSTYSAWWIKQAIKRALANQSKTIRLPVHVVEKLFRIRQATTKLQTLLERDPTDQELGDELGMSGAKIARLRAAAARPASLEAPLGEGESNSIAETVKDETASSPYEQLEGKTNASMMRDLIATLKPREFEILRHRFGLDGEDEKTLDEVGHKLGLTRERIRQLQNVAMKKLREGVERLETVRIPVAAAA